jgi:hypothetical protein
LLAFGLIAATMSPLVPGARAGWLAPVDISATGEHAGVPQVVLDAAGDATAVWERWNGQDTVVEAAYRPAGGGWQTPIDLSNADEEIVQAGEHNAYSPRLAVDAAGDTTVVWARYAGTNRILIQAVSRQMGGSWQAPVDLGEMHSATDPEPWVASDEAGDTTAVWKSNEAIESSYRPAGGLWEPAVTLAAANAYVPQAAMDIRGDAAVAWMHYDGSRYVVEGAYRPAGEGWGAPVVLSQAGEEGGDPQIALDGAGDMMVAWNGHPAGGEVVRAAYRPAGGEWQSPVDVSRQGDQAQELHAALDTQGDALLVWSHGTSEVGGYDIVQAAYRPAGGAWQEPADLSESGENAFPSDIVFDKQGNAAVVWERSNGAHDIVQADYRSAVEGWQQPVSLSEDEKDSTDAVVVLDAPGNSTVADGDATAVWTSSEGGCPEVAGCEDPPIYQIQAAGYDAIESAEPLEAPAVGEVGTPVAFSASPLDVWSPMLDFGDGSQDAATSATHTYSAPGEYVVTFSATEVLGYKRSAQRKIVIEPAAGEPPPPPPPSKEGESPTPGSPSETSGGTVEQRPGQGATTPLQQAQPAVLPPLRATIDPLAQTLRAIRRARELRFVCRLSGPGTCVVHTALGSGRTTLAQAGQATVTIRLTSRELIAMRHRHVLRLPFTATATAAGQTTLNTAGKLVAR